MNACAQIAECLNNGSRVILWGASNDAIIIINELRQRFHAAPDLIADSDREKQGKRFMGIPVAAFEEALSMFPDAYIYIVGSNYKYQIIGTLTHSLNFPADRILNYEPVVWKRGCIFIENALLCAGNQILFCSSDFGKKSSPRVAFDLNYEDAVNQWIGLREEISACLEKGVPCSCDGCCCVKEDWYAADRRIHIVNYSESGICNFECVYCNAAAKHSQGLTEKDLDLAGILSVLEEREMLADDLHIDYSPGEPAIHPKKEIYYDAFRKKHTTLIMTNASVYDPSIYRCLSEGKASLCVSVDAGTAETFAKAKGRNMFDKVCGNLRRYSAAAPGVVGLKYIFLPGVNDTAEDIDGFCKLCEEVRPAIILVSYDIFHPVQTLTKHTFDILSLLLERLDREGFIWKNVSDVIDRAFKGELL